MKLHYLKHTVIALALTVAIGCKHKHKPPSAELQEAYKLQQDALQIAKTIEGAATTLPAEVAARKKVWLENMIEIPGMDHDHSNCNHDHHRPTVSITDSEMLAVQKAWRDTILSIQKDIQ